MSPFELHWLEGPEAPGTALLRSGTQLVGRGRRADIVCTDVSVAREHCRLTVHPNGSLELESLESVTVAGEPVVSTTTVQPGDEIQLGEVRFTVRPVEEAARPTRKRRHSTRRHRERHAGGSEVEALGRPRRRGTARLSRRSSTPQSPEEQLEDLQEQLKEATRELRQAHQEIRKLKAERRKLDTELEELRASPKPEAPARPTAWAMVPEIEPVMACSPEPEPAMAFSPDPEPMMAPIPEPPVEGAPESDTASVPESETASAPVAENLLPGFEQLEVSGGAAEPMIEQQTLEFERERRRRARACEELLLGLEQQMSGLFEARLAQLRELFNGT